MQKYKLTHPDHLTFFLSLVRLQGIVIKLYIHILIITIYNCTQYWCILLWLYSLPDAGCEDYLKTRGMGLVMHANFSLNVYFYRELTTFFTTTRFVFLCPRSVCIYTRSNHVTAFSISYRVHNNRRWTFKAQINLQISTLVPSNMPLGSRFQAHDCLVCVLVLVRVCSRYFCFQPRTRNMFFLSQEVRVTLSRSCDWPVLVYLNVIWDGL